MKRLLLILFPFIWTSAFNQQISADTSGCAPFIVDFHASFNTGTYVHWDFGNGTSSGLANPICVFNQPGIYHIDLEYIDQNGDTINVNDYKVVEVYPKPLAAFSFVQNGNCERENTVSFSNNSSQFDSLVWNFGDGYTSQDINPQHIYSSAGVFAPSLKVFNSYGCLQEVNNGQITIDPKPYASVTISHQDYCGIMDSVLLDIQGDFTENILVFQAFSLDNVNSAIFPNSGAAEDSLFLYLENQFNCKDTLVYSNLIDTTNLNPSISFEAVESGVCMNQLVNFQVLSDQQIDSIHWFVNSQFQGNDDTLAFSITSAQSFSLQADLYLNGGCFISIDSLVGVGTSNSYSGSVLVDSILCKDEGFSAGLSNPDFYYAKWFVDGVFKDSSSVFSHSFSHSGSHEITVQVYDSNLCYTTIVEQILVPNIQADFLLVNQDGCGPLTTTFLYTGSPCTSYSWDFGDGSSGTGWQTQHTYTSPGQFIPSLTVFDGNTGCGDSSQLSDFIQVEASTIAFDTVFIEACGSYLLSIQNTYGVNSWEWDFGDGSIDTGSVVQHFYDTPGTYYVHLTTELLNGCQTVLPGLYEIEIKNPITQSIQYDLDCPELQVSLANPDFQNVNWYLNDSPFSSLDTMLIPDMNQYTGLFEITVESQDSVGCVYEHSINLVGSCGGTGSIIIESSGPGGGAAGGGIDTVQICKTHEVNFEFINLPASYQLISFIPEPGVSITSFPPHYFFQNLGFFQPQIVVEVSGVVDTIRLAKVFSVSEVIPSMAVEILPYDCDSVYLHLVDSINVDHSVSWQINQPGVIQSHDTLIALGNQNFNYNLTYMLSNSSGCSMEQNQLINYEKVQVEPYFQNHLCLGDSALFFTNLSSSGLSHEWDFDNGEQTSLPSGFYKYPSAGVFVPKLEVNDAFGCIHEITCDTVEVIDPYNEIDSILPGYCAGDSVILATKNSADSYFWNLQDWSTQDSSVFAYHFLYVADYPISLKTIKGGCEYYIEDTIHVTSPFAYFTSSQSRKCFPMQLDIQLVQNYATVSSDWIFYDSANVVQNGPIDTLITLDSMPSGTLYAIVYDVNGCSRVAYLDSIEVWDYSINNVPAEGCSPLAFQISAPSGTVNADWWVNNQNAGTGLNFQATIDSLGLNQFTYHVQMQDGCEFTSDNIPVQVNGFEFQGLFFMQENCVPAWGDFDTLGTYDLQQIQWSFGDGATSNLASPTHQFQNAGVFYPMLTGKDQNGCRDTLFFQDSIFVSDAHVDYTLSSIGVCANDTIMFNVQDAAFYDSLYWVLGDGTVSGSSDFWHIYSSPGEYPIMIYSMDTLGCENTEFLSDSIEVFEQPQFSFDLLDSIYCLSDTMQFSVDNPSGLNLNWTLNGQVFQPNSPLMDTGMVFIELSVSNNYCSAAQMDSIQVNQSIDIALLSDSVFCVSQAPEILQFNVSGGYLIGNTVLDSTTNEINISSPGLDTLVYQFEDVCHSHLDIQIQVDSFISAGFYLDSIQCLSDQNIDPVAQNSGGDWYLGNDVIQINALDHLPAGNYQISYVIEKGNCFDSTSNSLQLLVVDAIDLALNKEVYCFGNDITPIYNLPNQLSIDFLAVNQITQDSVYILDLLSYSPGEWEVYYTLTDSLGCSNTFSSGSLIVLDSIAPRNPEIIRSTVIDDNHVYTEWKIDSADLDKYIELVLFRTELDQQNWMQLGHLPKTEMFYQDYSADVKNEAYEYKIQGLFHCPWDIEGSLSNSILLEIEDLGSMKKLVWNNYQYWEDGVDHFEVQEKVNGVWTTVATIPASIFEFILPQ